MLKNLIIILESSRVFALPMTILSWLIIFTYSLTLGGNFWYGILSLIGVCLVHMSTNLIDDYFDYKTLTKQINFNKTEYLVNAQKTKCRYIISGIVKPKDLIYLALIYLFIAGIIGLFFFIKCGIGVVYFALFGLFIAFTYSFFSKIRLSELAVGLTYGPALFGGIYYVMTKSYSWDAIIISIPSMIMTLVLLYNHTVMDYPFDINEGHKTLANKFSSQLKSLIILKWLLIIAYITPILLCILDILDWQIFSLWLTIPLAIDLYISMIEFSKDADSIPQKKWYHFPMENMMGAPSFMIRIYQSRNLMIYFSIIFSISIFFALH